MGGEMGGGMGSATIYAFDMCRVQDVDQETLMERVRTFCHGHHDRITPIENVCDVLPELAERYELHLVTSRCESLRDMSLEWLATYGLDVFSEHHFTNGFGSLYPERKQTKLEVCQAIEVAYLIEDAPKNAWEVADGGVPVLLPNRPWNHKMDEHRNIARVQDWSQMRTHLMT